MTAYPPTDLVWRLAAQALITQLRTHGLVAELGHQATRAHNGATEPGASESGARPTDRATGPRLGQEVLCARREDGSLWWFWVWAGPSRHSPPELEPLCPIEQVDYAATKITTVLSVPARPPLG